ncbi:MULTISPECIES: phosphatase PAP2 family protein [Pseudovibrio]|uniref:phosphatase PAP2 family protein n=1 Tax=Stappiaceae TaxID=2821832 RepID=UPI002365FE04|nr:MULTISPECIES: phosphatase PAP2 family protein [Pseudovibrio]MDD7909437.1 phosphatase PAP2 family protein [Pseudovibrio exalbescens]MDX5594996.1 phosphatase PAP2 family protein [Pseudovibrio sp. SPO723]
MTTAYIISVSLFFLAFPAVDIWASQMFYSSDGYFPAAKSPLLQDIRYMKHYLVSWVVGLSLAVLLIKLLLPKLRALVDLRAPLFLISTLIIGPGLVVNALLKNNIGRPRPRHVESFGGSNPFVGVWQSSDYCQTNCSFVSGEASSSIWLVALVFIVPKKWKLPVAIGTIGPALVFSINRVAFGGHFLSDTMISWGVTFFVIWAVYWLLYRKTPSWAQPETLENAFTHAGIWLHAKLNKLFGIGSTQVQQFASMFR